jgi:hypothetical protein
MLRIDGTPGHEQARALPAGGERRAVVARALATTPRRFAFEHDARLIAMVRTIPGRIVMLVLMAVLLCRYSDVWPAIVLATAAISFTARRHAATVTAIATLAVFVVAPDWYGTGAPAIIAERAGLSDWLTPVLRWGAPCMVLGFAALFLAALRAGRPWWVARYPLSCLLVVYFGLLAGAIAGPVGIEAKIWLWSLTAAFGGYIWFIALVAREQRNSTVRVVFLHQFGVLHPFWGSTATPFTIAPGKLRKITAADEDALAASQIKGIKLLLWGNVIVVLGALYIVGVRDGLAVPTFARALARYMGPGLPWHLRWLSLFSDFFEDVIRIAATGHIIIGCARLAGYDLPRSTYRPLESRTIAEFWGRYFYYYKELLLNLFYFPAYLSGFRMRPRLRVAFATFMAAGAGNMLIHFVRGLNDVAALGLWQAVLGFQTFAFYCVILAAGIAASQLRGSRREPAAATLRGRIVPFVTVMGFYSLLHIFDDLRRTVPLSDHISFFLSLFLPFR